MHLKISDTTIVIRKVIETKPKVLSAISGDNYIESLKKEQERKTVEQQEKDQKKQEREKKRLQNAIMKKEK